MAIALRISSKSGSFGIIIRRKFISSAIIDIAHIDTINLCFVMLFDVRVAHIVTID